MNRILYLKTDTHCLTHTPVVHLGDICKVEGADPQLVRTARDMLLYRYPPEDIRGKKGRKVVVFSILKVIACIHAIVPDACVVNLGASDFIIEYVPLRQQAKWLARLKLAGVCIITFFGAAFTIMAFNNDISVGGVFSRFYRQVLGADKPPVSEIEVCYSIGLAIGILVFFNHIGSKKITMDPTPIQVELRKYEADVADTLIENASRDGRCEEVE